MHRFVIFLVLVPDCFQPMPSLESTFMDHGAKADGKTDDTAAIQRALDAAGKDRGGVVTVPKGLYRVEGHLVVPPGVCLLGEWQAPHHANTEHGTVILATGIAGKEDGPGIDQPPAKLLGQGHHGLLPRPRPHCRKALSVDDPGQGNARQRDRRDPRQSLQGDRLRHAPQRASLHPQRLRLPAEGRRLRQQHDGHRADRERPFQSARLGPLHVQRQGPGRGLGVRCASIWNRTSWASASARPTGST